MTLTRRPRGSRSVSHAAGATVFVAACCCSAGPGGMVGAGPRMSLGEKSPRARGANARACGHASSWRRWAPAWLPPPSRARGRRRRTTYSNAGALFGFNQLWTVPVMCFLLIVAQETAARMGCVTGRASPLIREQFGVRLSASPCSRSSSPPNYLVTPGVRGHWCRRLFPLRRACLRWSAAPHIWLPTMSGFVPDREGPSPSRVFVDLHRRRRQWWAPTGATPCCTRWSRTSRPRRATCLCWWQAWALAIAPWMLFPRPVQRGREEERPRRGPPTSASTP